MIVDLFLTAPREPARTFLSIFRPGDAKKVDAKGRGLLLQALANKDLPSRYSLGHFLLDEGAPLTAGLGGATVLHVLSGQVSHDVGEDAHIARRLIEAGADINARDENPSTARRFRGRVARRR